MSDLNSNEQQPITVSVSRKVIPGKEEEYETWIKGIIKASSKYPGHLGVNVLRPSDVTNGEYVIIYKYDTYQNACHWEKSQERADWLDKIADITQGEETRKRITGLEFWFDLPSISTTMVPVKYKMAIVLFCVVYIMVLTLATVLNPFIGHMPFWIKLLFIIPTQVLLMTYIIMPVVTKLLKNWLYELNS